MICIKDSDPIIVAYSKIVSEIAEAQRVKQFVTEINCLGKNHSKEAVLSIGRKFVELRVEN